MSRSYFDVDTSNTYFWDNIGEELEGIDEAQVRAVSLLADIAK
jgi:hypothetical protein